ncbi:MAG: hypothetical protein E8D52_12285 [Nitrospira sp.]|nr:MAG: hypothetical protein E8D52_12285 [Nitrospira sp.]
MPNAESPIRRSSTNYWKKQRPPRHRAHESHPETYRGSRPQQRTAAKALGVTQPRVSDLLRGRIDLFSTDALIDMLARLGATVRLTVKVRPAA